MKDKCLLILGGYFQGMEMKALLDKYFDKIEIENTKFIPVDDAKSDAAYLLLIVPTAMLKEYAELKGSNRKLPAGKCFKHLPNVGELWKETGLGGRLRNSNRYKGQGHESLNDILDYLEGDVTGGYQELHDSDKIRMNIQEIPEFYED